MVFAVEDVVLVLYTWHIIIIIMIQLSGFHVLIYSLFCFSTLSLGHVFSNHSSCAGWLTALRVPFCSK